MAPARRGASDDRILPLINVVFLLLIFFMLAGRLSVTDPFPVEPPESASQGLLQDAPIVVYLAADGRTALGEQILSREQLAAGVRERLDGVSDVSVQLKADARAETLDVVELMGLLREAGVDKLKLITFSGTT